MIAHIKLHKNPGEPWEQSENGQRWSEEKDFATEPVFMRFLLNADVPLIVEDEWFLPLCLEYPGGSGIDIIYLGNKGRLMLCEAKHKQTYNRSIAVDEALHRPVAYGSSTLAMIDAYTSRNPKMAVTNPRERLAKWCHETIGYDATLADVFKAGRLIVGLVAYGLLKDTSVPIDNVPFFGCGVSVSKDGNNVLLHTLLTGPQNVPNLVWPFLVDAYERYERTGKKSTRRKSATFSEVNEYFLGLPDASPTKIVYKHFCRKGFIFNPGGGQSAGTTVQIKIADSEGKPRTILNLLQARRVDVHGGNLLGQVDFLEISKSDVWDLLADLTEIAPQACKQNDGAWLQMDFSAFTESSTRDVINLIIARVDVFVAACVNERVHEE